MPTVSASPYSLIALLDKLPLGNIVAATGAGVTYQINGLRFTMEGSGFTVAGSEMTGGTINQITFLSLSFIVQPFPDPPLAIWQTFASMTSMSLAATTLD